MGRRGALGRGGGRGREGGEVAADAGEGRLQGRSHALGQAGARVLARGAAAAAPVGAVGLRGALPLPLGALGLRGVVDAGGAAVAAVAAADGLALALLADGDLGAADKKRSPSNLSECVTPREPGSAWTAVATHCLSRRARAHTPVRTKRPRHTNHTRLTRHLRDVPLPYRRRSARRRNREDAPSVARVLALD